jgi:hypothetical protein
MKRLFFTLLLAVDPNGAGKVLYDGNLRRKK